jgi:hypothetical protein
MEQQAKPIGTVRYSNKITVFIIPGYFLKLYASAAIFFKLSELLFPHHQISHAFHVLEIGSAW